MNKFISLIGLLFTISLFLGCSDCDHCSGDGNYKFKAKVYYINQTSEYIKSIGCDRDIEPNKTFIFEIVGTLGSKPTTNDFPASVFSNCSMAYTDGENLKCENGIRDIKNYEDRKEITPLEFEFTFRFTEEKKAVASLCE